MTREQLAQQIANPTPGARTLVFTGEPGATTKLHILADDVLTIEFRGPASIGFEVQAPPPVTTGGTA